MASAPGTYLLDPDGSYILDAAGNRMVSNGVTDCPCCWRYPRNCDTDDVASYAMTVELAGLLPGAFKVTGDDACWHFDGGDAFTETQPATVKVGADVAVTYDSCVECLAVPCADGPPFLHVEYRAVSDDSIICEADIAFTGACTWDGPIDCPVNVTGITVFYDSGTSRWAALAGGDGDSRTFYLPDYSGSTAVPLGAYVIDVATEYIAVRLP